METIHAVKFPHVAKGEQFINGVILSPEIQAVTVGNAAHKRGLRKPLQEVYA